MMIRAVQFGRLKNDAFLLLQYQIDSHIIL